MSFKVGNKVVVAGVGKSSNTEKMRSDKEKEIGNIGIISEVFKAGVYGVRRIEDKDEWLSDWAWYEDEIKPYIETPRERIKYELLGVI